MDEFFPENPPLVSRNEAVEYFPSLVRFSHRAEDIGIGARHRDDFGGILRKGVERGAIMSSGEREISFFRRQRGGESVSLRITGIDRESLPAMVLRLPDLAFEPKELSQSVMSLGVFWIEFENVEVFLFRFLEVGGIQAGEIGEADGKVEPNVGIGGTEAFSLLQMFQSRAEISALHKNVPQPSLNRRLSFIKRDHSVNLARISFGLFFEPFDLVVLPSPRRTPPAREEKKRQERKEEEGEAFSKAMLFSSSKRLHIPSREL